MIKVLLAYEDYAELVAAETMLKKLGFDVIGITNEYTLAEQIVSFNPDVVIGSGNNAKISALGIGRRLKEMGRWAGKSILIFPATAKPSAQDLLKIRADIMLESPVQPFRLLQVLAKLTGNDEASLLQRYSKSEESETSSASANSIKVGGGSPRESDITHVRGQGGAADKINVDGGVEDSGQESSFFSSQRKDKDLYQDDKKIGGAASEDNLFPDVDLLEIEREILGQQNPANQVTPRSPKLTADPDELSQPAALGVNPFEEELLRVKAGEKERTAKYQKFLEAKVPETLHPQNVSQSNMGRVAARKRQRELVKDWDKEKLNDLDELRREFAQAMFKKS